MSLHVFNTLSGKKETFAPLKGGEARIYVCGVTVYDSSHIGHARSLLTFDVAYRYLVFLGYRVVFVRNFTDVDDKIIQRARDENSTAEKIAGRYIEEFQGDSRALGLLPPTHEPKATDNIAEIVALIRRLEEKGVAYRIDGDVYFSVERFPGYGKLSRKNIDELEAGARVEVDERKKAPMDFALWKSSKPGEPAWDSPWGKGRPGWHIECSAMSTKYLGQPFDIHGGGRDLIFPHHENEIAQSEAAYDLPLARVWMHNGFLNINHEKMSKSLGNILSVRDVLARHEPAALRHYMLSSHYRSPMDFSEQGLDEAEKAIERVIETIARYEETAPGKTSTQADPALLEDFRREMDDDFNTPRALALVFDEVRALNRLMDEGQGAELAPRVAALKQAVSSLGLLQEAPAAFLARKKERWLKAKKTISRKEIEDWIERRNQARVKKDWREADRIRDELFAKGIVLEDSSGGTIWKVK
jgi:cysteinyl-tRNA synthetase